MPVKDLITKSLIYHNYNVIINLKHFYNQSTDSDLKRHVEIRNLTTEKFQVILQYVY